MSVGHDLKKGFGTYLRGLLFHVVHSYKHIADNAQISIEDEKYCRRLDRCSPYV